jgi:hypothetical protein
MDQPPFDQRWQSWRPCRLLDGAILINHVLARTVFSFLPSRRGCGGIRALMLEAGQSSQLGVKM